MTTLRHESYSYETSFGNFCNDNARALMITRCKFYTIAMQVLYNFIPQITKKEPFSKYIKHI